MLNLKLEDKQYLEELQKDYDNTITYYKDLADFMKGWLPSISTNKHFLTKTGLKHDIDYNTEAVAINKTTKDFISYICRYFRETYGLSNLTNYIENNILTKYVKYNFTKTNNDGLHYMNIIEDICDKLSINDFDSATIDDLRLRIKQAWKYNFENDRVKISKNKIKISDYGIYVEYDWDKKCSLSDKSKGNIFDLLQSYSYINTGKTDFPEDIQAYINNLNNYHSVKYEDFFKAHTLNVLGVISMTFLKNKSLEFKFHNEEDRDKFVRAMKGEF